MNRKSIAAIALAAFLVAPAMAADDDAKGKKKKGQRKNASPAMSLIKQLEPVGLTDEQVTKIKELGKTSLAAMKQAREDAGITPELMKKRAEAQKGLKDSGKKGKDLQAAINEKAGISEAQAAVFAKLGQSRQKFQRDVVALLTDEQKGKLPEKMKRLLKAPGKNAGGKKKKKKAE